MERQQTLLEIIWEKDIAIKLYEQARQYYEEKEEKGKLTMEAERHENFTRCDKGKK